MYLQFLNYDVLTSKSVPFTPPPTGIHFGGIRITHNSVFSIYGIRGSGDPLILLCNFFLAVQGSFQLISSRLFFKLQRSENSLKSQC